MKIEELSIGDWVITPQGNIGYIINLSTTSAAGCAAEVVEVEEYIVSKWECLQLKPVPLTPEILEKNGVHFVEDFEDGEYLFACPSFSVIWFKGRGEWKFCVPQSWLYIRSVHQLQHILRLASIEKEIEL